MVNYKDLGLVNSRELFKKAINGGYAIPAFNFNNMEQMQAIIQACVEAKSPVILQVSSGARKYANQTLCAIWLKVQWNTQKNWVMQFLSFCTWITAIRLSCANPALSTDFLP